MLQKKLCLDSEKDQTLNKIKKIATELASKLINHGTGLIAETGEGCSILYSTAAVIAYDENFRGQYGYGMVLLGGLSALVTEILHKKGIVGQQNYHYYRIIKEALAGAMVAAIFTEEFLPEEWQSVAIGASIAMTLASSKVIFEVLRQRRVHHNNVVKFFDYTLGSVSSALTGAGIADYLFFICEGFDSQVPRIISLPITGALALGNVLAELPVNKVSKQDNQHHRCYHPARGYRAGIYSADISLFLVIFLFDLIQAFQNSDDIQNYEFALVISLVFLFQFLRTFINKLTKDQQEEHDLIEAHAEEQPLLHSDQKAHEKNGSKCTYLLEKFSHCYHHFWKKSERELQDKHLSNVAYISEDEAHVQSHQHQ